MVLIAQSECKLQSMLLALIKCWQMKINTSRTNVIHFRKTESEKQTLKTNCKIQNQNLEVVDSYKYLLFA